MSIQSVLNSGAITAFNVLGTEIAQTITYENASTVNVPGSGNDPTITPDPKTSRAVFDDIEQEQQGLVPNEFTKDIKQAIIIQSELDATPALNHTITDNSSVVWVIRTILEDPASVNWILLVTKK